MARTSVAKTFIVHQRTDGEQAPQPVRLLRATKVAHVQKHIAAGYDIREASADELVDLGAKGVRIEDVKAPE